MVQQLNKTQLSPHSSSSNPKHLPKSDSGSGSIVEQLYTLSAVTERQTVEMTARLRAWTFAQHQDMIDLESLAYSLSERRSKYEWRYTFPASSSDGVVSQLNGRILPTKMSRATDSLFLFTGRGAQWYAMGRELSERYLVFRHSLLRSDEMLQQLGASWSLICELGRSEQDSRIHQSEIAQPSSTALQIAIVDLLSSFGIRPAKVIGHSSGEIGVAYTAGAISHETALKVSYSRSLLLPLYEQKESTKGACFRLVSENKTL